MTHTGNIQKMEGKLTNVVNYYLPIGNQKLDMNSLIGKEIELSFDGEINCVHCGKRTRKSYAQGHCYPCMIKLPQTDACIMRPELCMAHKGVSRDMDWAENNCLKPHYVYLAISSGLKVGVTRESQIPTRWIDQGAIKGIILAKTPNRNTAGRIEVSLKQHFSDKTNWRNMLANKIDTSIDLVNEKENAIEVLDMEFEEFVSENDNIIEINYPVLDYPEKVKSIGFDKYQEIKKTLKGIKGQYLIFDDDTVLNIRKHTGYNITIKTN